ncbi:MAG: acetyl-CoA carboxylase biotin carboxyl carrier protein subunit [Firmicutes bacterium]|nr:acetyl-CoA carboxylase biotin carboxyl carrier protein subunit [Bacillota bacterium]
MVEITAPIGGKIFQVHVAVGDQVELDDEVIVIEAMKMETPVMAPQAGTVKEIKAAVGDNVSENQVLMVIE